MKQKSIEFLLKAKYSGKASIAALQNDLSSLKKIKTFEEMGRSIRSTNVNIREAKVQVRDLRKAVKAGAGGKELTRQYSTAKTALARLVASQKEQIGQLRDTGLALKSAGVDTSNLAVEQGRLATVTENSSKAIRAASILGVRPYKDIKAQVKSLGVAYRDLKTSGVASGAELEKALDSYRNKVRALNKERGLKNPFSDAMKKLDLTPFKKVKAEISSLKQAYKLLGKDSSLSVLEMAKAKDQLKRKIWELRDSTSGWARHLDDIQQHWMGLTAVIAGTGAAISGTIKAFAGFDDSMRRVQAVSGASKDEMAKLSETARSLGGDTKFMAQEVAQGMSELAQSGMGTGEILQTIPHVLNLAAASGMDFKDAADRMTDSMKQFGLGNDQAARMADVFTKGFTSASTSAEQLSLALTYVGPIARDMGYSVEETVAVLDTLAEAGFKGQRAGTALRGGFARLLKPTGEAQAVLDKYGVAITDSGGKTRKFTDIIADLSGASMTTAEKMTLFGMEAGPGMSALLNQGADTILEFEKSLLSAGGAAADVAGKMEGGIGGALRSLRSAIGELVLQFGDVLEPLVIGLTKTLKFLAEIFAGLSAPIKYVVALSAAAATGLIAWELGLKRLGASLMLAGSKVQVFTAKTTGMNKAVGLASKGLGLLMAWDIGQAIGNWLNGFGIVKKTMLGLIYHLDLARLKAKQFWKWMTGGDTEGVKREIQAASDAYSSLIDDIDSGKDKGVAAHKKVAAAAAQSAQSQVDSQVGALNEMGEAYGKYADQVKKLMPGDDGYEGSEAYQSWGAIEGAGLTLDAPEDGMTKDELAEFNRSKKEREEKENPEEKTPEKEASEKKGQLPERDLKAEQKYTDRARERNREKEKEIMLEKMLQQEKQKGLAEELALKERASRADDTARSEDRKTVSSGGTSPQSMYMRMREQMSANRTTEPQSAQEPIIKTPEPVVVDAPALDVSPALTQVFDKYVDRKQQTIAKSPWSIAASKGQEPERPSVPSPAVPDVSAIAAPLANMKQQARDAVAAVPASLAAMTSSSVHNLISKMQGAGSGSSSSGSQTGAAAIVPKKIVELRFRGGSVNGGERDVDALVSLLETAGLTA